MNTAPAQTSDDDEFFQRVTSSVGNLTPNQENEVRTALDQNASGVAKLAERIASNQSITSPAAVFLTSIRRGDHRKRDTKTDKTDRIPPLERAHALFTAKLRDLAGVDWTEAERIEYAIDYALDHCGTYGQNVISTETQLRNDLRVPRYDGSSEVPNDPARNTQHIRDMIEAHREEPEIEAARGLI